MTRVVAYVMARDEAEVIADCLASLRWCDEVVVADTGSRDDTAAIAAAAGATVIRVPFTGFGPTRNAVLRQLRADWVVCFDADEVCPAALAEEIRAAIASGRAAAWVAPRRNYLLGREVRHSGWRPDYRPPVVFDPRRCHYSDHPVHEELLVDGTTLRLREPFDHFSYRTLRQMMDKQALYADLGADKLLARGVGGLRWRALAHASAAFARHYLWRLGFLDGWAGLIIAVANAYGTFFRYAIADARARGLERGPRPPRDG